MKLMASTATLLIIALHAAFGPTARSTEIEGFTEPYRTINLASSETGLIVSFEIKEGDRVRAGQIIARLDRAIHESLLAIAEDSMNARGRLQALEAELELRKNRLSKFTELLAKGHARREEVERAKADVAIADGHVRAELEDIQRRRLEYQRILLQLNRRSIRSPIDGVILRQHKQLGESVAPNDPHLVTLVQLDPLLAVFSVSSELARGLQREQQAYVRIAGEEKPVPGKLDLVSPVTDAESGTIRVTVRLENQQFSLRSGERCSLLLPVPKK